MGVVELLQQVGNETAFGIIIKTLVMRIPGIRPGDETKKYVSKILTRLTVFGATFLVIIAGLPIIFSKITSLPTSVSIGGTGLLIVIGVVAGAIPAYRAMRIKPIEAMNADK